MRLEQNLLESLFALQDLKYKEFHCRLMPTVDPETVIGVRVPLLRKLAVQFGKTPQAEAFLHALPHRYYEENNVHGCLISAMTDYEQTVAALDAFLPYVDNWATCDQLSPRKLAEQPEWALGLVRQWLADGRTYVVRFAIGVLLQLFLDERFSPEQMGWVAAVESDEYYVNMMRAWYVAEAVAKQPAAAAALIESGTLDRWTHNKAIQKARESRRVAAEMKEYLATLGRHER